MPATVAEMPATPPLVLRIDDVGPQPATISRALQLLDVADSYGIPTLIAVTPWLNTSPELPLNVEEFSRLRSRLGSTHQAALHGLTHNCHLLQPHEHIVELANATTTIHEFACRDHGLIGTDIQESWLAKGINAISEALGQTTDFLVPPAHYFDENTLAAATNSGVRHIATYDRFAQVPWQRGAITMHPCDVVDYLRVSLTVGGESAALLAAHSAQHSGTIQVFWHASYDELSDSPGAPFSSQVLNAAAQILEAQLSAGRTFALPSNT